MIDLNFIALVNLFKQKFPCSTESLDRTPLHNRAVKGAKKSWHLTTTVNGAKAIDLIFDTSNNLVQAAQYAQTLGFGGIEIDLNNNHLHLDGRPLSKLWHVVKVGKQELRLEEYLTTIPLLV